MVKTDSLPNSAGGMKEILQAVFRFHNQELAHHDVAKCDDWQHYIKQTN